MTERKRKLIIKTALMQHKNKLEKKLVKEREKFDKLCAIPLPARKGVRGGANTKLIARIDVVAGTMRNLKEMIEVLEEEISK